MRKRGKVLVFIALVAVELLGESQPNHSVLDICLLTTVALCLGLMVNYKFLKILLIHSFVPSFHMCLGS